MQFPSALGVVLLVTISEAVKLKILDWGEEDSSLQVMRTTTAASRSQCGLRCAWDYACVAVSYGGSNGRQCRLMGCLVGLYQHRGQCQPCKPGWPRYRDACYLYRSKGMNFTTAESHCDRLWPGAHLTSVMDAEENAFVHSLIKYHAWIGLKHLPEYADDEFRRMDGSAVSYTNWKYKQPDGIMTQHLGVVMLNSDGEWFDAHIRNHYHSVCKYSVGSQ